MSYYVSQEPHSHTLAHTRFTPRQLIGKKGTQYCRLTPHAVLRRDHLPWSDVRWDHLPSGERTSRARRVSGQQCGRNSLSATQLSSLACGAHTPRAQGSASGVHTRTLHMCNLRSTLEDGYCV